MTTLKIATFNLRFASDEAPHSWVERRPLMRDCIAAMAPDLMGTQEGLYHQLQDIAADQPDHSWIGLGRDGGSHGEFMAIWYRRERLRPLEYDHFWLSDTPSVVGSSTWGHHNRRMVTWVRFRDLSDGSEFLHYNTHLDHENQTARERAAQLIARRVGELEPALPCLLTGDFNVGTDNVVYEILHQQASFTDTWATAEQRGPELSTWHGYRGPEAGGTRIDWILARGPVRTLATEIVTFQRDGQYPSDHCPLVATLAGGAERPPSA